LSSGDPPPLVFLSWARFDGNPVGGMDGGPALNSSRFRVRRGVIGVIRADDRLLVVRRASGVARAGCWCFPGGHVEAGETPWRALQRELLEELGVGVAPRCRLGSIRLPESGYVLAVWAVQRVHGTLRPAPAEIAEVRWMTAMELRSASPGLPSNEQVLQLLSM
jgi:mutator protein MutT